MNYLTNKEFFDLVNNNIGSQKQATLKYKNWLVFKDHSNNVRVTKNTSEIILNNTGNIVSSTSNWIKQIFKDEILELITKENFFQFFSLY